MDCSHIHVWSPSVDPPVNCPKRAADQSEMRVDPRALDSQSGRIPLRYRSCAPEDCSSLAVEAPWERAADFGLRHVMMSLYFMMS